MKRIGKPLLLIAVFAVSCVIFSFNSQKVGQPIQPPPIITPPQLEPEPEKVTPEEAKKTITSKDLKTIVAKLCSYGGRSTGSEGNVAAAKYIKKYFEEAGLKTEYQDFGRSKNIIAYIEGENENEVVVVGAHMDDVGRGGADDNASGTAAVMEIAQAFSKLPKPSRTITFQCYSGEEQGMVGSRYYVEHPLLPKSSPNISSHIFMINLDMIGYDKNQVSLPMGGGASDHASFERKGVASIFLHTGTHRYYHTAQDTPEKLNYAGMEKIAQKAFDLAMNPPYKGRRGIIRKTVFTYDHDRPDAVFLPLEF